MARRRPRRAAPHVDNSVSQPRRGSQNRQGSSDLNSLPSGEPETIGELLRELTTVLRRDSQERPAESRARKLFESVLTPEQHREYRDQMSIHVTGQSGRLYRIDCTHSIDNVTRVDRSGRVVESICAAPVGCPLGDKLLAQLLYLKYDEREFRRRANITRYEQPREPLRRRHRRAVERIHWW